MIRRAAVLLSLLSLSGVAWGENWPGWRGPKSNGQSGEKNIPLKWSATENVRWQLDLPGPENSSPIVWGQRVFITQTLDKKGRQRALWCIDRANGKRLWERVVEYGDDEPKHGTNTFSAATPVTDGQRVVASFGSAGLYCWDLDGKELWKKDLGKIYHLWGTASSPILHQNLAILWCSPGERQFLIAFDKVTGEEKWRVDEPGGKFGKDPSEWLGTWCTPAIARIAGRDELIIGVPEKVKAFNPQSGELLWTCDGLGKLMYTSAVVSDDGIAVIFGGFHGPALAVRCGGNGDVTKTHRLWLHKMRNPQRIGSAVIVGKHVFLHGSQPEVIQCFDIETGKDLWEKEELPHVSWSSLVLADGKLFLPDEANETHIFEASPTFKQIGTNILPKEIVRGSLAISDGEIFIRSHRRLYCISERKGN